MPQSEASPGTRERVLQRIERLAFEGLDAVTFLSEAGKALERAVPFDPQTLPTPYWVTIDPASLLVTSVVEGGHGQQPCEMSPQEWAEFEYGEQGLGNRVRDVIRHPRGVQSASDLLHAHPDQADEFRALLADIGAEHEVLVALRAVDGMHWGAVYLNREPGRPDFSPDEREFLGRVAPHLAEGVRRGLLIGEAADPQGPSAPAITVLDADLELEACTPGAERWLAALPQAASGHLPLAVLSVAQSVFRAEHKTPASVRVHTDTRGWVMLHGQALAGARGRRAVITIQPVGPEQITALLMSAYGLTDREEQVTRHVLQGRSTAEIAAALAISGYTVQDHLKSVFEKTSVSSRRELAGRVFARHYEPRVEDNSARIEGSRPVRGGPWPDQAPEAMDTAASGAGVSNA
jgi:DNA-binding CsgD family transcriptional regulator